MKKLLTIVTLAFASLSAMADIDVPTYRKIDSPGMSAGEVLLHAGEPDARERNGGCFKFMYRGKGGLAGKIVTVLICNNAVVKASTD